MVYQKLIFYKFQYLLLNQQKWINRLFNSNCRVSSINLILVLKTENLKQKACHITSHNLYIIFKFQSLYITTHLKVIMYYVLPLELWHLNSENHRWPCKQKLDSYYVLLFFQINLPTKLHALVDKKTQISYS